MVAEEELHQSDEPNKDIEKRKPKPFRYIRDESEIDEEITDLLSKYSVMTSEKQTSEKLKENFENTLGIGNIDVVERIIEKHKQKRSSNDDIDIA